jgi:hypothetical protein
MQSLRTRGKLFGIIDQRADRQLKIRGKLFTPSQVA